MQNSHKINPLYGYLIRNGHARRMQRVISMNLTPAEENGGQEHAIRLRIAAVSSLVRYI